MENERLFRHGVVYQIYPRSFCDSNGDGIGDLPGIISKLDYLQNLGIKIIWLSPIYKSPLMDMGYDVADYYSIHPDYGTMEDFDRLLEEAKKRGIRIVMDLVVNHTSDEHEWFIRSKDKTSPYHDYYIWRKGRGEDGMEPPNNWTSQFTGPAWSYDPEVGEWYLHLFSKKQPDLNWHNPKVLEEVEAIIDFYMKKGVYGFRCDVINQIYKESLEDGIGNAASGRGSEHYLMKDGNHRILRQIHDDIFAKYPDSVMIGETFNVDLENGRRFLENQELDMFFHFDLMELDKAMFGAFHKKVNPEVWKKTAFKWQEGVSWNANYLENHDQLRSINRFGDPKRYWKESGKMLAMFNLCLRGTPFVYEGQEIGMLNLPMRDPAKSKDCVSWMVADILKKYPFPKWFKRRILNRIDRDHERAPMQWNDGVSAGFSTSKDTWIEVNENKSYINVEAEKADPDSILNFYRRLIAIHNESEALCTGEFIPLETKGSVIAWKRKSGDEELIVLLNFGKGKPKLPAFAKGKETLLSNYEGESKNGKLRPFEACLLKA
ncbi:MAG: alpha-glucosidase [Bacilli bacterium]|nr:alpha-glucosidase [Bacilli bacterium]